MSKICMFFLPSVFLSVSTQFLRPYIYIFCKYPNYRNRFSTIVVNISSFFLPHVFCDANEVMWRKILRRSLVEQPSSHLLRFSRIFLDLKVNTRKSVHRLGSISPSSLSLADWRDTRGKYPLARNLNRSWWHRHKSIKIFVRSPRLHGQQDFLLRYLCNSSF